MHIHVVTLFPELFSSVVSTTMWSKGQERGALKLSFYAIRDYATGRHRVTNDTPYGGGPGMILKPEPLVAAIEASGNSEPRPWRILLCPQGRKLTQAIAAELATRREIALVCGRYEGIDERVRAYVDEELSIGDYIVSGGEIAAIVVIDAVARLQPGFLGHAGSAADESFGESLLEYPQYTRPLEYRGARVPEVLLSGDHGAIARWRREQAVRRTAQKRRDLIERASLSEQERHRLADGAGAHAAGAARAGTKADP